MNAVAATNGDYRAGFVSAGSESPPQRLPVTGALPPWLAGTLLRTGPALFDIGGASMRHWFDGLAMLHRFSFSGDEVEYQSRFLGSRAYRAAQEGGRIAYKEFATDPCRTAFKRVSSMFSPELTDNGAVNIARLGNEFVAMTETPLPVSFDPATLEAAGVADWSREIPGQLSTAHPHHDAASGELIAYATKLSLVSRYRLYALAPGAKQARPIASIKASRPSYMHSFALSEGHLVLSECPLVVNPLRLALSGRPYIENYRWEPERGSTFLVVDRSDGSTVRRETEPFFCFHHVNAFRDGGALYLDLAAYEDAGVIDALYLDRLRRGEAEIPTAELRRYRIPLGSGEVTWETLTDADIELPRIDYERLNGRAYRYVYGIGLGTEGDAKDGPANGLSNQIVKIDVEQGSAVVWREDGCFPGEPVFVRAPTASREDAGVLLSLVLDADREQSFLLVLDAESLTELGRAAAPQRIPFGLHGSFQREC